jgi:Protein of unknown function (DUF2726)
MSGYWVGNGLMAQILLAVAVTAIAIYFIIEHLLSRGRRLRPYNDVGRQLDAVMAGSFEKKKLLSYSEYNVFKIIEGDVANERRGYRVFAQTSLGEILASGNNDAFRSINSKRVDILIIDQGGWPVLAIEYQGEGHYQGSAAARDAIKKEALRKAGIGYIEVLPADTPTQIRARMREQLGWTATRSSHFGRASQTPTVGPPTPLGAELTARASDAQPSMSSST